MLNKTKCLLIAFKDRVGSIPSILLVIYTLTLVVMNILASKTIYQNDWIALDGGIVITWLIIVVADIVNILKGPKTAICMSIFAILVNIIVSLIFYLVGLIPSVNGSSFNTVLSSNWFILVSSTAAFLVSSSLNALINYGIGKRFKDNPDGKAAFCLRNYVSTVVSQIIDNMIFSSLAYMVFAPIFWDGFSWTFTQVMMCALTYGGILLFMEIFVTPLAYKVYMYFANKNNN